jgi:hypothetical protein
MVYNQITSLLYILETPGITCLIRRLLVYPKSKDKIDKKGDITHINCSFSNIST